jgi:two-component system cell cycle sensor histidine kinase/response regulator CckA
MASPRLGPDPKQSAARPQRKSGYVVIILLTTAGGILAAWPRLASTVFSINYLPQTFSYLGSPALTWMHFIGNVLIGISFLAIFGVFSYLARKERNVRIYSLYVVFALLALGCCLTNLAEGITTWIPVYVLSASLKLFTAIVSSLAAILLLAYVPRIIAMLQKAETSEKHRVAFESAERDRKDALDELSRAKADLERRVHDRTVELEALNSAMQCEIGERIRVEKQLVKIASIVESSEDAILTKTLDGVVTTWNKGAERIYGYSAEEIIGQHISILVPPDRAGEDATLVARVGRGERVEHFETTRVTKDGRPIDVSLTLSPIRNLSGEIIAASSIARDISERKQSELALRRSHQRTRDILDNIFAFVGLLSTDGVILDVNRAPLEMGGLRREDVIGKLVPETYWYSYSPEVQVRVQAAIDRAAMGETVRYDELIRAAGDTRVYIDLCFCPLRNSEGRVIHVLGSAVDISERVQVKDALVESEKQYRLLFDSSPLPMWVFDRKTFAFLEVNEAAVEHYGYSREEFRKMTILDIRPEEDRSRLVQHMTKLVAGLQTPEVWKHRKKDGTLIDVEVTSHELAFQRRDAQLVVVHDITEQLKAEENLRHSEEKFSKTFRSTPLPITISTVGEGRYIDVNEAFSDVMGYDRERVIGRTALDLKIWADFDERKRMIDQLTTTGRVDSFETQFVTKGGEKRTVLISAEIIRLDSTDCVIAITNDITETRRLEEQFRQAQKMEAVGRLAGGVAHDFNNILGVIIGYSDLSREQLKTDDRLSRHIEQIKKAALRGSGLTRQLLAFSRQQVLQPSVLNLNAVVNNVSKMLLRVVGEDVSLNFVPGQPLGSVKLDLGQIEQVLMNLVINARDAMPRGGRIILETANVDFDENYAREHMPIKAGPYVMLAVSDTGSGIEKETLARIFEPFFTTKPQGEGTGLGLSMVYGVVQQSGGSIWVYSEVGKGTIFKMYFPRVNESAISLVEPRTEQPIALGTETILLVEDEEALRELTADLLKSAGYKVVAAVSGEAAVDILKKSDVMHLLLTDVIMSGMSGSDLAALAKELRPTIKVLYMSGYTGHLIENHGVIEAKSVLLQKPFTKQALLTQVRAVLDAPN